MALVLGTNSGFVSSAPSADPEGTLTQMQDKYRATAHTSPSGTNVITNLGWYCDNATEAADYQMGVYSNNAATNPNSPNVLIASAATGAKGTTAGWKSVAYSTSIDASTIYHIALQLDNTASETYANFSNSLTGAIWTAGPSSGCTELPSNWTGTTSEYADWGIAFYALYKAAGGDPIANMMYHYMHH